MKYFKIYKTKIVYTLLFSINLFLLFSISTCKIENGTTKKNLKVLIDKNIRQGEIEKIIVKEKKLTSHNLNLIAIWNIDGCGSCKEKMASKFGYFKEMFNNRFEFVYIGDNPVRIKMYNVQNYLTLHSLSVSDIFEKDVEIKQPFILLTNKNGDVLLAHEMILGDTIKFNEFNKNLLKYLEIDSI